MSRTTKPSIKRFVETLCRFMVSRPDDISVEEVLVGHEINIVIKCHPSDFPKLLGRSQANLMAVKFLCLHASEVQGKSVSVILAESGDRKSLNRLDFEPNKQWTPKQMTPLLDCIFDFCFSNEPVVITKNTPEVCTMDIRLDETEQLTEERVTDLSIAVNRVVKVAGNMQGKKVAAGISI